MSSIDSRELQRNLWMVANNVIKNIFTLRTYSELLTKLTRIPLKICLSNNKLYVVLPAHHVCISVPIHHLSYYCYTYSVITAPIHFNFFSYRTPKRTLKYWTLMLHQYIKAIYIKWMLFTHSVYSVIKFTFVLAN